MKTLDGWRWWVAYVIGAVVLYVASLGLPTLMFVIALVVWVACLDVAWYYGRRRP